MSVTRRPHRAALFAFVSLVAASRLCQAGIINLTTSNGTLANDGLCSLPEAIVAANTNAPYYGCPRGSGDDTIQIPIGSYVDLVSAPTMNVTSPIEITTFGSSTKRGTIYGGSGSFVVKVGGKLKLTRVSVTAFDDRTAIFMDDGTSAANRAELTLTQVEAYGNYTDAGAQTAFLHVGTAAYVTIDRSYIHDNRSIKGGAMRIVGGTVYINRSVLARNTASQYGGAIQLLPNGGYAPYLNVLTSTIVGNTAGYDGGALDADSASYAGILYSTITGNRADRYGSAIHFYGTSTGEITLYRDVIADNPDKLTIDNCKADGSGTFYSSGQNVLRNCGGGWTVASDVTLRNAAVLGLAALPAAATDWIYPPEMVPSSTSPLVFLSGAQCSVSSDASYDQNYTFRPADGTCAAGASDP
jgi:hypothetical protein